MQRFHAIMAELTIRIAMVFETWSFYHAEKVHTKMPKYTWVDILEKQQQYNKRMSVVVRENRTLN